MLASPDLSCRCLLLGEARPAGVVAVSRASHSIPCCGLKVCRELQFCCDWAQVHNTQGRLHAACAHHVECHYRQLLRQRREHDAVRHLRPAPQSCMLPRHTQQRMPTWLRTCTPLPCTASSRCSLRKRGACVSRCPVITRTRQASQQSTRACVPQTPCSQGRGCGVLPQRCSAVGPDWPTPAAALTMLIAMLMHGQRHARMGSVYLRQLHSTEGWTIVGAPGKLSARCQANKVCV